MTESKRPYHHGNLRAALLDAAVTRARFDGPAGVTVRDVARDVGVSPSAAYRHIRDLDHLLALVAQYAREQLARSMQSAMRRVPVTGDPAADALARFAAVGRGYVRFATRHVQLFRTAFVVLTTPPDRPDAPDALAIIRGCVDDLVATGLLAADAHDDAVVVAWSAVHGISSLLADSAIKHTLGVSSTRAIDAVLRSVAASLLTR